MIGQLMKIAFYLFLISYTPIPIIFFLALLFISGKDILGPFQEIVVTYWNEMIVKFELYYLNELFNWITSIFIGSTTLMILLLSFLVIRKLKKLTNREILN